MRKLDTPAANHPIPAPRIAQRARQEAAAESTACRDDLNELAWFLDGNSGDIPEEVLARLNALDGPRH